MLKRSVHKTLVTLIIIATMSLILSGCLNKNIDNTKLTSHTWQILDNNDSPQFTFSFTSTDDDEVVSLIVIKKYDYYKNESEVVHRTKQLMEVNDTETDGFKMDYQLISVPGGKAVYQESFSLKPSLGFRHKDHKDVIEYLGLDKYCNFMSNTIKIDAQKIEKDDDFPYHSDLVSAEYDEIVRAGSDK